MTVPVRQAPLRLRLGLLALALILLLSALLTLFPPDGVERASWAQFIGRFHLLTVHFPIALVLIVPVLEWAGRNPRFPYLRASVDFLWPLAIVEQPGGSHPGMVPGTKRRILRTAGYPAHVGRSIACRRLLALLDVARLLPRSAARLPVRLAGHGWACVVDGISRRPAIAR